MAQDLRSDDEFITFSYVYLKVLSLTTAKEKINALSDVFTFGVSNVKSDDIISKFEGDKATWFLLLSGSIPNLGIPLKTINNILETVKPTKTNQNVTVQDVYSFFWKINSLNRDEKLKSILEFQQKLSNKEAQCFINFLKRKFLPKSLILTAINNKLVKLYQKNNDIHATLKELGVVLNKKYNYQIPTQLKNPEAISGRYFATPLWTTQKQLHLDVGNTYENVEIKTSAVLELVTFQNNKPLAFDILYHNGVDISDKPLSERLKLLDEYIKNNLISVIEITPYLLFDLPSPDLLEFINEMEQDGLPGILLRSVDCEYKFKKDTSWYYLDFFKHDVKYATLDVDGGVIKTQDDIVVGKDESMSNTGPMLISYRNITNSMLTHYKILRKSKEVCLTFKELQENKRCKISIKRRSDQEEEDLEQKKKK